MQWRVAPAQPPPPLTPLPAELQPRWRPLAWWSKDVRQRPRACTPMHRQLSPVSQMEKAAPARSQLGREPPRPQLQWPASRWLLWQPSR
eukprot:298099-Prymnesium_polylepis.1